MCLNWGYRIDGLKVHLMSLLLDAMQSKEYCTFMYLFFKVVTLPRATTNIVKLVLVFVSEQNYVLFYFFIINCIWFLRYY